MQIKGVLKVVLVDINPAVVRAWRIVFSDLPEVQIVGGSILDQQVDAWVTPTNAQGNMDGGVDAVIKRHLGPGIEKRVQQEIRQRYEGHLPVGCATCVPTGKAAPRFLISTPTMVRSADTISDTLDVALACAAAFQMIHQHNRKGEGVIGSVAVPGLGVGTGQVPVGVCASLMWTGYVLFGDHEFDDFASMKAALLAQLSDVAKWTDQTRVRVVPPA